MYWLVWQTDDGTENGTMDKERFDTIEKAVNAKSKLMGAAEEGDYNLTAWIFYGSLLP